MVSNHIDHKIHPPLMKGRRERLQVICSAVVFVQRVSKTIKLVHIDVKDDR